MINTVQVSDSCHVLFVEDNSHFRNKTIQTHLRGCSVIELNQGRHFLQVLEKYQFHFILMDYELPDNNGEVLVTAAREYDYTGPIIGISSSAYLNQKLLEAGADTSIEKRKSYLLPKVIVQAISIAGARGFQTQCTFGKENI
jgi:CheY-like chemotaxis protein